MPSAPTRKLIIPGSQEETISYAVEDFVSTAKSAIDDHGSFSVALSGGSTPKAMYQMLAEKHKQSLNWEKVLIFWSDERAVAPSNPESNYHMAMENGLNALPLLPENIFRMPADSVQLEQAAQDYEALILQKVPNGLFDLVMLGMGDDGHTASLFPHTQGLQETEKLVIPNFVPKMSCWRMTFSFPLINKAKKVALYVIGEGKTDTLYQVFSTSLDIESYPSQGVGSEKIPSHWIADFAAARKMKPSD